MRPKLSGDLGVAYQRDLGRLGTLNARIDQTYQTQLFLTPANDPAYGQSAYGLLSARVAVTLPSGGWTVALWGHNLTSRRYIIDISPIITLDQLNYGDPATYGVQLSRHF